MKSFDIIGYAADADIHCEKCIRKLYKAKRVNGDLEGEDHEGNEISPMFADEGGSEAVHCGTCGCELWEGSEDEDEEGENEDE